MKKLEKLLDKISNGIRYLRNNTEVFEIISLLVVLLYLVFLGIMVAICLQNYFLLSLFTYVWVRIISEVCIHKIFFERFNYKLSEIPKSTSLINFVLFVVAVVLSWKYFAATIFLVILAFMHGDYAKFISKMQKKE